MDYDIRPMTSADIAAVHRLWQASEGVGLSPSDSAPSLIRHLQRNPGLSSVAISADGALLGALLCGHDGVRGYLRHLAVAREARGHGIARALVARSLDQLRALQIHKCSAYLFTDNTAGQEFWGHLGWFERNDLTVMQVILTDPAAD
jgi:ribosomal protein S18 acetylase RimI-like enzyme